MSKRVCGQAGCPTLIDATAYRGLCDEHKRARDRSRGSRADRGYGTTHQAKSRELKDQVRAGQPVLCWRCGDLIDDPDDLHVGHDDNDRSVTRGAEHAMCNLTAAGRASHS